MSKVNQFFRNLLHIQDISANTEELQKAAKELREMVKTIEETKLHQQPVVSDPAKGVVTPH